MSLDKTMKIRIWRLALTCVFLFLISWRLSISESSWSLITIWFVMYEYSTVGGVVRKSWLRFWGTLLSAIYGLLIVYCCGNNPWINIMALVAGLFLFGYFFMEGGRVYTGTIGAVTLTIVLLNYNDMELAVLRVFNVMIGIVASVLMMRFFYPQYARNGLIDRQLGWLNELIAWLEDYLDLRQQHDDLKKKIGALEEAIYMQGTEYARLLLEAKMETKKAPFFVTDSAEVKTHCQHLFQSFHVLSRLWPNEIRDHQTLRQSLEDLLASLYQIRARLLGNNTMVAEARPRMMDMDKEDLLLQPALGLLLKEAHKTVMQLEQVIASTTQVYQYYKHMLPQH